jgi:hypothetical protein
LIHVRRVKKVTALTPKIENGNAGEPKLVGVPRTALVEVDYSERECITAADLALAGNLVPIKARSDFY